MRNKRSIITLLLILLLSLSINLLVYAAIVSPDVAELDGADCEAATDVTIGEIDAIDLSELNVDIPASGSSVNSVVRDEAELSKTYGSGADSVALSYVKTEVYKHGRQTDVYVDADGDEYRYDSVGNLVGYNISGGDSMDAMVSVENGETGVITENQAIAIANKAASAQFGDKFKLVEFEEVATEQYSQIRYVSYAQKLGSDGFVRGLSCMVTVLPDGTVFGCDMINYEELISFDESLLNGISKEAIYADLDSKTQALYGDTLIDYEVGAIQLINVEGAYTLQVSVPAHYSTDWADLVYGKETYYYAIPQP